MIIKRKPGTLKGGIKKIVKRIKEVPFDNRPSKPSYIELKTFAALGGVKGATRRAIHRVRRAAKDRLKHGLLSPEAVERVTNREIARATEKASTPLKQDIRGAITNTKTSILNTPQNLKTAAVKTKDVAKNIYENTGNVMAKTAGMIRENPELAISQGIIAPVSRVGSLAFGPGVAAAYNASPVGLGTASYAGMKLLKRPNSVVMENGRPIKKAILRKKRGNEVARSISSRIGNKSIKNSVEGIKNSARSIMEPINSNSVPSYKLMRVTA